jgi:hypothetical protein
VKRELQYAKDCTPRRYRTRCGRGARVPRDEGDPSEIPAAGLALVIVVTANSAWIYASMLSENSTDELTVMFVDLAGQTFERMVKQPGIRSYLVARLRHPTRGELSRAASERHF